MKILNFIYTHKDEVEVGAVTLGGLAVSLTVVDHILRVSLTALSIGFVIYKWRKESKKK